MLVIHWSLHNTTDKILANGIRPSTRAGQRGVWVYPFSKHRTLNGNWRRNLKVWDNQQGNYNGFIFRLTAADFPLKAGDWMSNRSLDCFIAEDEVKLAQVCGDRFTDSVLGRDPEGENYSTGDFELVLPNRISPERIIRVLPDRDPKKWRSTKYRSE
jgi:hypothetical protein